MITIATVGIVIMSFILGFSIRGKSCDCCIHWDYDIKAGKLSALETEMFMLERENERLNHIYGQMMQNRRCFEESYYAHCRGCDRVFRSADMKGQEVADLLSKITLSSEEIAKKLDIKIG